MKKVYIATGKALAIARQHDEEWVVDAQLTGLATGAIWLTRGRGIVDLCLDYQCRRTGSLLCRQQ